MTWWLARTSSREHITSALTVDGELERRRTAQR
jgi:hypothetical protein